MTDQTAAAPRRAQGQLAVVVFAALLVGQLTALYWPRVSVQGPVTWTDKVVHLLVFALPVMAGLLARLPARYVVTALALHAPLSELIQYTLLPGRSGDWTDAVADLGGVALGVLAALVWRARNG